MFSWLWLKIKEIATRSWANNKKVHKKALKKPENIVLLLAALFILAIFSYALIPDEPRLGLSFLFAGSMAIYAGYIYKGMHVMGYVLSGVILATVISSLLPGISNSYKRADYIGVIILISFGFLIWYISSRLKKGEMPDFNNKPTTKRRRRKLR